MKLSRLILQAIFFVALASIFMTFLLSILFQYSSFSNEKQQLKKEYIQLKQEEIKEEVLRVHRYIQYSQNVIEQKMRYRLKLRVHQAYALALELYEKNKNIKTHDEIKYLIAKAIQNLVYDKQREYFFINENSGKAVLLNKQIEINNHKNLWNLQDKQGTFIVQRQSKIVQNKKEGFVINYFVKPDTNDNIEYQKLSYVKDFEPFDWHIGMGEYIDEVKKRSKEDVLSYIATIRFGTDGYIFVNNTRREALIFDGKKLKTPKYYPSDELYKKQLDAIKSDNGGYFFYKFKKLDSNKKYPKMAYVKEYKDWNWIIGTGIYIDEIENQILKKENILLNSIFNKMNVVLFLMLIIGVVIYFISKKISGFINQNIMHLIKAFNEASLSNKEINTKKLTYKEFETLAKSLNSTLSARQKAQEQLNEYVKIINENVITSATDVKGNITDVSEAFCRISGYTKEELIGQPHSIVRHEDMPKEFYEDMWKKLNDGIAWEGEIKNKKKNAESYWINALIKPKYEKGEIIGFTAIKEDITDKKRVEVLSITDELTQLYNRRHFNKKIDSELNRAKRENTMITFIMLDVDYFKKYNDTYGHHAGDAVLKQVAKVLKNHTKRASDFSFRLGGEEFGIIYTLRQEEESEKLALFIQKDIEALQIEHKTSEVSNYLTVSMGVISKKALEITNSDEFYKKADQALYKAKSNGRNCIFRDNT